MRLTLCILILLAISGGVFADITSGLASQWKFNETSGSTVSDSSGNSNKGIFVGTPAWSSGKFDNSAVLDGASNIVVPDSPSLSPTNAITISAWFKTITAAGGYSQYLISKKNAYSLTLSKSAGNGIGMSIRGGSTTDSAGTVLSESYTDGQWHNFIGVFDGNAILLYFDGQKVKDYDSSRTVIDDTAYDVNIGGTINKESVYNFNGQLDDTRIYNRALTAGDISEIYALGSLDSTPPTRSSGSPTGTLSVGTTSTTISLSTNENATCRYSTSANITYDSMTNTFSTTGGLNHSNIVTGLSNGNTYTYYVRCRDISNNKNSNDYSISFNIPLTDTTPPTISNGSPTGSLTSATTQINLTVNTNENATCKYGTTPGVTYASKTNTFSTTGSATHLQTLTGLLSGNSYTYYIRCKDSANNTNTNDYAISFSVNTPWVPPIGIPVPAFGIEESYRMYDNAGNRNSSLTYTQNSEGGYYTHYIDNSVTCSDAGGNKGTASSPRCSLPSSIEEGSVIEVHGGPYTGGQYIPTFNCTSQKPCWLRGHSSVSKPKIRLETIVKGSYTIIENLHYDESPGTIGLRTHNNNILHHVSVRNSELRTVSVYGNSGYTFNNLVIYDNNIHADNFVNLGPDSPEFPEYDLHGVATGGYAEQIWIVDNDIHDVSGDAVGNAHGAQYTAKNYYVGRNKLHDTGENGVDFKEIENVVVSQNEMYNFYGPSSGSNGAAIVVHYGPQLAPVNAWFLFNNIHDAKDTGIQIGGSMPNDVFFIGNLIHNIGDGNTGGVGIVSWNSGNIFLLNNVIYNTGTGIDIDNTSGGSTILTAYNNIVSTLSNDSGYHINLDYTGYREAADLRNNIFYQPGATIKKNWSGSVPACSGCLENTDPKFVNPSQGNFRLQSDSPAIDAGTTSPLYQQFYNSYGVSITKDYAGTNSPQGSAWDIGAYEYVLGGDTTAPVVSITAPAEGETVSGTITISASATDNGTVAGVQFKLDGTNIGSEDTSQPYSITFDTTTTNNGSHIITAVARDIADNTATSQKTVIMNNEPQENEDTNNTNEITEDTTTNENTGENSAENTSSASNSGSEVGSEGYKATIKNVEISPLQQRIPATITMQIISGIPIAQVMVIKTSISHKSEIVYTTTEETPVISSGKTHNFTLAKQWTPLISGDYEIMAELYSTHLVKYDSQTKIINIKAAGEQTINEENGKANQKNTNTNQNPLSDENEYAPNKNNTNSPIEFFGLPLTTIAGGIVLILALIIAAKRIG